LAAAEDDIRLPLLLKVCPSRSLNAALAVAHILAGVGLAAIRSPILIKVAIGIVLALSLFRLLRRIRQGTPAGLQLQENGYLSVLAADGALAECRVDPATTVLPWLIVLRLATGGTVRSLVIPRDALGSEGHRTLRTWLRWRAKIDPA
jgi:hypothetical protein